MRKLVAFALVGAIALQPQKVEANPIAAPAAFCLGTAGFGCVLVATTVVGGVVYYIWQRSDGKRTQVRAIKDNAAPENKHSIYAKDASEADQRCRSMGKKNGFGKYLGVISHGNGTYTCRCEVPHLAFG